MDKMIVRVPVAVKAKVTEDLKLKIVGDLQNTIKNMELDLEQFEFQAKKALHQAASDLSVLPALREQIDMERNKNNKTGGYGIGRSVSDLLEHIAAGA